MRTVVRRAALSLESDLPPDPELLIRAAQGAVWLADLPLAEKLAQAAIHAGGGAEANFVRAHALSWLSRGEEADAVLARIPASRLSEMGQSRRACLRAVNMLWSLADPSGAKQHIDDAFATMSEGTRGSADAFLAMYWAAMGQPAAAMQSARELDIDVLPAIVGAVASWGLVVAAGDAGQTSEAVAAAERADTIAAGAFDSAHMRFVIADAHLGALLLAGRIKEARSLTESLQRRGRNPAWRRGVVHNRDGRARRAGSRTPCGSRRGVATSRRSPRSCGGAQRLQLPVRAVNCHSARDAGPQ